MRVVFPCPVAERDVDTGRRQREAYRLPDPSIAPGDESDASVDVHSWPPVKAVARILPCPFARADTAAVDTGGCYALVVMPQPQTYANHVRLVPAYLAALLLLIVNAGWSLFDLTRGFTIASLRAAVVAVALVLVALYARSFALRAQDRIIRLEMRLRLREVLPPELHPRIAELTINQLVALRFAGDRELPGLVTRVLTDGLEDRKVIKQLVTDWQADDLRV
jgi:hypothetical protein